MKKPLRKNYDGTCSPANQEAADWLAKKKTGAVFYISDKEVRNYEFHKKYFGMLKVAYDNQEEFINEGLFRKTMQVKAGYYDPVYFGGETFQIPKSISFDNLSQEKFEKLYSDVLNVILASFGYGEEFQIELIRQFG